MAGGVGADDNFGSPVDVTVRKETARTDLGVNTQAGYRYNDA